MNGAMFEFRLPFGTYLTLSVTLTIIITLLTLTVTVSVTLTLLTIILGTVVNMAP